MRHRHHARRGPFWAPRLPAPELAPPARVGAAYRGSHNNRGTVAAHTGPASRKDNRKRIGNDPCLLGIRRRRSLFGPGPRAHRVPDTLPPHHHRRVRGCIFVCLKDFSRFCRPGLRLGRRGHRSDDRPLHHRARGRYFLGPKRPIGGGRQFRAHRHSVHRAHARGSSLGLVSGTAGAEPPVGEGVPLVAANEQTRSLLAEYAALAPEISKQSRSRSRLR